MPDKKPTYKERNGTTRVGDTLRWLVNSGKDIAPEILDIVGKITGIDGLNILADKINDSKTLTEFDKKILLEQIEVDRVEMQEISKRWQSDMASDSWASKNIRPYATGCTLIFLFIVIILDSSFVDFIVEQHWVELLKGVLSVMIIALFGSRSYEKIKKVAGKIR